MFFIHEKVFVRNAQNIYVIAVEWKNFFLEFIHFYMRIKKNYASFKKKILLREGYQSWIPINKLLKYS